MSKFRIIGIIVISIIFSTACEKYYRNCTERPSVPDNQSFDISIEGENDFSIQYSELTTMDYPSSGGSIIGSVRPKDGIQLLYKSKEGYLFFQKNDTISNVVDSIYSWNSYGADVISIDRNNYCIWDEVWRVYPSQESDHYLAFKSGIDSAISLGWLQLELDAITGEISLIDFELTNSDELIIK